MPGASGGTAGLSSKYIQTIEGRLLEANPGAEVTNRQYTKFPAGHFGKFDPAIDTLGKYFGNQFSDKFLASPMGADFKKSKPSTGRASKKAAPRSRAPSGKRAAKHNVRRG